MSTNGTSLRERHRADTRARIVQALGQLLVDEHPASLSVPAVARQAGVSVATVYRYFPTKEALLEVASEIADQLIVQGGPPISDEDLEPFLLQSARSFREWAPLVQAQFASPIGREIRRRRLPRSLAAVTDVLATTGIDTAGAEGRRLVRLITTITSSVAILDLLERQDLEPEQVAADLAWTVRALVRVTREDVQQRTKVRAGRRRLT